MRIAALVVLLHFATAQAAETTWLHVQSVRYVSMQDPSWVVLDNGSEVQVRFGVPNRLSFSDMNAWPEGMALQIAYSADVGEVLLNPQDGSWIPLRSGLEKHSIDVMADACLEENSTTQGMVECFDRAIDLWEKEINRICDELLVTLPQEQGAKVRDSQVAWLQYRDAQAAAIGAIYVEGTISRIHRASAYRELVRQRAESLAEFLASQ